MALVLCVASNDILSMTRRMILEQAGHIVTTVHDIAEIEQACRSQQFDVAVIGQAFPKANRLQIRNVVRRKCPTAKILELYTPSIEPTIPDADDWLETPSDTPADLATRVSRLAPRPREEAAGV